MRRAEKELKTRAEIDAVIDAALSCRVAMVRQGLPYIVPLSHAYDGTFLYFHSATQGEKIDILRENPEVCVEFEDGVELRRGKSACRYSMNFRSVIVRGRMEFVQDEAEKRRSLELLVRRFAGNDAGGFPDSALAEIAILRLRIVSATGKLSFRPSES